MLLLMLHCDCLLIIPSLVTAAHSLKWHDPTFGMILISGFWVNQVGL